MDGAIAFHGYLAIPGSSGCQFGYTVGLGLFSGKIRKVRKWLAELLLAGFEVTLGNFGCKSKRYARMTSCWEQIGFCFSSLTHSNI